jgi:pyruvate dehydrogenase E1 component
MRSQLRKFFEVNRYYVVIAALKALSDEGSIEPKVVSEAMRKFRIDPEKPSPTTV